VFSPLWGHFLLYVCLELLCEITKKGPRK
jgi:hypothetical protein